VYVCIFVSVCLTVERATRSYVFYYLISYSFQGNTKSKGIISSKRSTAKHRKVKVLSDSDSEREASEALEEGTS